jgi:LmbE family N-acetylglucosaminyl deacetylase
MEMGVNRLQEEPQLVPYKAAAPPPASRVLVLAPHPDDEVFGCGGCARLQVQTGSTVDVVVITDGSGAGDPAVRQDESRKACRLLGTNEPVFWGYRDRALGFDEALVARLSAQLEDCLRQGQYDLVYAPSPWEVHPDHRAVARCTAEAVLTRRQAGQALVWAAYEVGAPLWPSHLVDITTVLADKQAAMRVYASQDVFQDYSAHIGALNRYRTYTLGQNCLAAEALWVADEDQMTWVINAWDSGFRHPGLTRE